MNYNKRKYGISTSYIAIFLSSILNILLTPIMLKSLGIEQFGLYQLINSFVGYLIILNLGTGVVTTRYISKMKTDDNKSDQANFLATIMIISVILSTIIIIISIILNYKLPSIFVNLKPHELKQAQNIFIVMVINLLCSIFISNFEGLLIGYDKYTVSNILRIVRIIIRAILLIIVLNVSPNIYYISIIDTILSLLMLIFMMYYTMSLHKIKIKLYKIDKILIRNILSFSSALFLQSIVGQVNMNVDKFILGIMTNITFVGIYSIAMSIFMVFSMLSSTIYSYYVPEAVKLVNENTNGEKLTDFLIKPSRLIFIFIGGILSAFIILGQNFIILWVGEDFISVWLISLIIMIPTLFITSQSIFISLLNAKDKRMFRSIVSLIVAIINILLTIVFVSKIGYIGAPISTAIALIVGDIIIMNIYYVKVIKINIRRFITEVISKTLVGFLIIMIINIPMLFLPNNIIFFIIKSIYFLVVFIIIAYSYIFNSEEILLLNNYRTIKNIHKEEL